ncbi:MAG: glycosyltransferase family 4 protein [Ignavibacteriaceae bacterium]|nr:glycosyltransferase family 4 protein [Ignavibacteriaceae bacterium]
MKILALTRYSKHGASSRYRFFQFFPYLINNGFSIQVEPLLGDNYIRYLYLKSPLPFFNILYSYFKRVYFLLNRNQFDLIWLQQEAFPWIPAWFENKLIKSKIPLVVDYDDAFFHRYDLNSSGAVRFLLGSKIDSVMGLADCVIVGNSYLADRAKKSGSKKIEILPTVVDLTKYPYRNQFEKEFITLGWIGSPSTAKYLKSIEHSLRIISEDKRIKIVLVGSGNVDLHGINFTVKEWNESTEVEEIQKFDIGIMPLLDTPWEKGKCGFKLIQYMASVKPVIASPVGVNVKIVNNGVNGFLAKDSSEWVNFVNILKSDFNLRMNMGLAGRKIVESSFSLEKIAPQLSAIFRNLFSR